MPARQSIHGTPASGPAARRTKFQADLAPADDRLMRTLKQDLQVLSNSDLLSDALALYRWAVTERRQGRRIVSEGACGDKNVLVFPRLERIADTVPETPLPRVEIKWTGRELRSLARLVESEPAAPNEALIRAVRG